MQMVNAMVRTQTPKYGISLCLIMPSLSSVFTDIGVVCEFDKCARPHTSNLYTSGCYRLTTIVYVYSACGLEFSFYSEPLGIGSSGFSTNQMLVLLFSQLTV